MDRHLIPIKDTVESYKTLVTEIVCTILAANRGSGNAKGKTVIRPTLKTNDFVAWPTITGQACGRVQALIVHGSCGKLANFAGFNATPENPVARIVTYEKLENGWNPTDNVIYRPIHQLSPIEKPKAVDLPVISIRKKDANKVGEITVYSDIGSEMWGGISSKMFKKELDQLDGVQRLEIRINSGGGDAFEGLAMHNMIKQFKADEKVSYVDSLCASAATVVALGAQTLSMAEESWFMVHRSATLAIGNINDFQKVVDLLGQVDQQLIRIYNNKTNLGAKKIEEMIDKETWMNSEDALANGFVDEITTTSDTRVAASLSRKWFKNPPQALAATVEPSGYEAKLREKVAQQVSRLRVS